MRSFILKINILVLILFTPNTPTISQHSQEKILYIISNSFPSQNVCDIVAFKIHQNKVEVDNCYKHKIEKFQTANTFELNTQKILDKLYKLPTKDLKKIETDINATNCDYNFPIQIIVVENGVEKRIEWKRVNNCYPKSAKSIIRELEIVFKDNKRL